MQLQGILGSATILLFLSPLIKAQDISSLANSVQPQIERQLTEHVIPFWLEKTIDEENGGFLLNHDIEGKLLPNPTKMIVSQSRMIWLFARLARAGYLPEQHLAAAKQGFEFLKTRMWDPDHGGFFWEVSSTGTEIRKPKKHLYGQSFAIYALAELARTTKDTEAIKLALRLFELLETHAYDPQYGGYLESFERDWARSPNKAPSYMGVNSGFKLMNTHLHLLESFTALYRAAPSERIRERLKELITIQSRTVVRPNLSACTDKYTRSWKPVLNKGYERVSYGHDLENIWLLMDACKALEIPDALYLDLYERLFSYSLTYGYDKINGGFYDSGLFNRLADRRDKVWWVQAEALVAALYLYEATGKEQYRTVFLKTHDWIEQHQLDTTAGDWFSTIDPQGNPHGGKASPWKAGYHNGRALIECLELLAQTAQSR